MKKICVDLVNDHEQRNLFLAGVRQQLLKAVSRDDMQTVLDSLTKDGLDVLASSEHIDFPRALSRMKKAEMIAILLDEIICRATIIKNGEKLTVNGEITPLMEAAYNLQGRGEYVAEEREKQQAILQSLRDSVVVRVVDWKAVEEKKSADNSVLNTELEPQDITARNCSGDYSTECEECAQFDRLNVDSNNTLQAFVQDNENNTLPDGAISSFVPAVVEITPVSNTKVIHWGFKWRNNNFSTLSDEHLIKAGLFLGLKIAPSISRNEIVKIITERVNLILQQTPDEETASCYGQNVQQSASVQPVSAQRKSKLSALLNMADKAVFTSQELRNISAQAFEETRIIAHRINLRNHPNWPYSRTFRPSKPSKTPVDESRQYKINF